MTAIVITGYVPLTLWRHCIARGVKAFESNGSLLFHRHVTPLDIITARVALEVSGTIMAGLIVVLAAMAIGMMQAPVDVGLVYLGLFFHTLFSYASALIIASLSERSDVIEKSVSIVSYLSLPFSGAFTMVDWVPQKFQWVLLWSPSVHNVEMIRAGQFGPGAHPALQHRVRHLDHGADAADRDFHDVAGQALHRRAMIRCVDIVEDYLVNLVAWTHSLASVAVLHVWTSGNRGGGIGHP